MKTSAATLLLLVALLRPASAGADALEQQIAAAIDSDAMRLAAQAARNGFQRFRRSMTLGPTVSVAPAITLDDDRGVDVQIGAGLVLLRYGIGFTPSPEQMRSILLSGVTSAVMAQIRAAEARGEVLSEDERRRIVADTWQQIKGELLLELRPRRLEKPRFELVSEVGYLPRAEAWDVRALIGIGVSKVMVAAGASFQHDDGAALVIPVELSVPVLLTDSLRSPVAQIFVRGDFDVTRDDPRHRAFVGVRFALDVL